MIINYRDALLEYAGKTSMNGVTQKVEHEFRVKLMNENEGIPMRVLGEFLIFSKQGDYYSAKTQKQVDVGFYEVIANDEAHGKILKFVKDIEKKNMKEKMEKFKFVRDNLGKMDGYGSIKVSPDMAKEAITDMIEMLEKFLSD